MAFRFPSFGVIATATKRAVVRFPVALVFFLVTDVVSHVLVGKDGGGHENLWRILVLAPSLAMLAFAVRLRFETRGIHRRAEIFLAIGLVAVGAVIYRWAPNFSRPQGFVFVALWWVFVAAVVALAPFSRSREFRGFWQHCRTVIDRGLIAGIFAGAAYGGLALALASLEGLFGVRVAGEVYGHLFAFIFTVGFPTFVLAAYPADVKALDGEIGFPGALRLFAQWVMVPLVSVYALILLAYTIQILVRWEWPKGTVGWLISWAGVLGISANLVLLPLVDRHELRWIRVFLRAFYAVLFVFATLLMLATYRRVSEYGWTEERVVLAATAGWFFVVAVYYTVRPRATRQWIPASLGLLAIVLSAGPFSAARIAMRSQTARLDALVARLGLREHAQSKPLPVKVRRELWDQFEFFRSRGNLVASVKHLLPPAAKLGDDPDVESVMTHLGQPNEYPWDPGDSSRWAVHLEGSVIPVGGFERIAELDGRLLSLYGNTSEAFEFEGRKWIFKSDRKVLTISDAGGHGKVSFDLEKWWAGLDKKHFADEQRRAKLTPAESAIDGRSESGWKVRLYVRDGFKDDGAEGIQISSAWLAFRLPPQ